jgi:heptosyltransferase-1
MRILLSRPPRWATWCTTCRSRPTSARTFPGRIDWVVEEGFADIPRLHPGVGRVIPVAVRRWRKGLLPRAPGASCALPRLNCAQPTLRPGARHPGPDQECPAGPPGARARRALSAMPPRRRASRWPRASTTPLTPSRRPACGGAQPPAGRRRASATSRTCRSTTASPPAAGPHPGCRIRPTRAAHRQQPRRQAVAGGGLAALGRTRCAAAGVRAARRQRRGARPRRAHRRYGMAQAVAAPPMGIAELAQLLAGARLVVGVDTGLSHIAAALGRPPWPVRRLRSGTDRRPCRETALNLGGAAANADGRAG